MLTNAVKRSETPDARIANVAYVIRARDSAVQCTATEMCLSIQKVPFCLDLSRTRSTTAAGPLATRSRAITRWLTTARPTSIAGHTPMPEGSETTAVTTDASRSGGSPTVTVGFQCRGCGSDADGRREAFRGSSSRCRAFVMRTDCLGRGGVKLHSCN